MGEWNAALARQRGVWMCWKVFINNQLIGRPINALVGPLETCTGAPLEERERRCACEEGGVTADRQRVHRCPLEERERRCARM